VLVIWPLCCTQYAILYRVPNIEGRPLAYKLTTGAATQCHALGLGLVQLHALGLGLVQLHALGLGLVQLHALWVGFGTTACS
jgi:hypothetical protein